MAMQPPKKMPPKPSPAAVAPAAVVKQAKATVTQQHADGAETTEEEALGEMAVDPHNHCMVEISVGMTRNLGDFNSMKFHVGITLPSLAEEDALEATFASGKEWIDNKVNAINAEIDGLVGAASDE